MESCPAHLPTDGQYRFQHCCHCDRFVPAIFHTTVIFCSIVYTSLLHCYSVICYTIIQQNAEVNMRTQINFVLLLLVLLLLVSSHSHQNCLYCRFISCFQQAKSKATAIIYLHYNDTGLRIVLVFLFHGPPRGNVSVSTVHLYFCTCKQNILDTGCARRTVHRK